MYSSAGKTLTFFSESEKYIPAYVIYVTFLLAHEMWNDE